MHTLLHTDMHVIGWLVCFVPAGTRRDPSQLSLGALEQFGLRVD